ncbi:MAG: hypothetical protein ACE5GI_06915 [Candidatus Aminicenantales bacterium]
MKYLRIFFILIILLISSRAAAQERGFGAGIILGEPTGLSFKSWISSKTAVDFGLAWSFGREDSFHLHGDYLIHNFKLLKAEKGKLVLYYGIGGRLKAEKKNRVGIRIPVGLVYLIEKAPLDIFFELAPLLDLAPATEVGFNAGLGIRYYF